MDWTSIFLESGEEELVSEDDFPTSAINARKTRLSRLVSAVYEHHHRGEQHGNHHVRSASFSSSASSSSREEEDVETGGYTLRALYCFSINYILGVGVCGIPYAFYKSGYLLGSSLVILITIISYMTVMWVAETGVRAEILLLHQQQEQSLMELSKDSASNNSAGTTSPNKQETTPLLSSPVGPTAATTTTTSTSSTSYGRNTEVTDLVKLFLGPIHYSLYKISLLALMYIGLLAYTQVFCVTLHALLFPTSSSSSNSSNNYYLPLIIFSSIVLPLSCMELEEQITTQAILSIIRFVVIFAMILSSTFGLVLRSTSTSNTSASSTMPLVDTSGFGVAFSTALFSQLFQHSVPGLIRPLSHRPTHTKKKIRVVFGACLLTTCALYLLLGITASSYFLQDTNPSVNLNFVPSHGKQAQRPTQQKITWVVVADILGTWINYIILLFPALDTLSVFPLVAITLGNNLLAVNHGHLVHYLTLYPNSILWMLLSFNNNCISCPSAEDKHSAATTNNTSTTASTLQQKKKNALKVSTVVFRLIAAIPPLLGSLIASDLSFSLQLAGVAGLYVAFVTPALLQRTSHKYVASYHHYFSNTITIGGNIYSGWYSKPYLPTYVLIFASFSLFVVCLQIRNYIISNIG